MEKLIQDKEKIRKMRKIKSRINVLGRRLKKPYVKQAYMLKTEKELEEMVNEFVSHIVGHKVHEIHGRSEK